MRWGRTSCSLRMQTKFLKASCTVKHKWWRDSSKSLKVIKSKSATSSPTWSIRDPLDSKQLPPSSKIHSMTTGEWCWKWWRQSICSWTKWSFFMKIPRVARVRSATKLMSLRRLFKFSRIAWREGRSGPIQWWIAHSILNWWKITWIPLWSGRVLIKSRSKCGRYRLKRIRLNLKWKTDSKTYSPAKKP